MDQNMESSLEYTLKYDSEYTLKYSGLGPLEKNTEKRPRIIYLKIITPWLF
jgi:hypothetical protein